MSSPLPNRMWGWVFRRFVILAGCLSAVAAPVHAGTSADERAILDLHKQWAAARIAGDVSFLERFYAPDFTIHAMNGSVVSRATDIDAFAKRNIKPDFIDNQDMTVRIYGKSAVVTGIEHVRGTAFGRPGDFRLRFTNVLVRKSGSWQLVQHQTTPIR